MKSQSARISILAFVVTLIVCLVSFAQPRPIQIGANPDQYDPDNIVLWGMDLDEDDLYDDSFLDAVGLDLLDANGNIQWNIHIVPFLNTQFEVQQTDITIGALTEVHLAQNRSILVADNVSFTVNGIINGVVSFGFWDGVDYDYWMGAVIIDEEYDVFWDTEAEPFPELTVEGNLDGINIDINYADFILGGAVDADILNWDEDWGLMALGDDQRAGPSIFLRSTRPNGTVFSFRNSKILGSHGDHWRSPEVPQSRNDPQYKALEVHGNGNPNAHAVGDWADFYEDGNPFTGAIHGDFTINFENVEVIGWDCRWWDGEDERDLHAGGVTNFTCSNSDIYGDNFRFSNCKFTPERDIYIEHTDDNPVPQVMHQITVNSPADNTIFDNCFFAQSHLEVVCIEGRNALLDNCEVTDFHTGGFYPHSHLVDVKPLDSRIGEATCFTAIRNSIIHGSPGEGIHYSNGILWAYNNLIHTNGSGWPMQPGQGGNPPWDKNAGLAIHPGYSSFEQREFVEGGIFCEPHVINNTFIANSVGLAIFPEWNGFEVSEDAEIINNTIVDGKHWSGDNDAYAFNRCNIWYSEDPIPLAAGLKPRFCNIWEEDDDGGNDGDLGLGIWVWDGQEGAGQPANTGEEWLPIDGGNGWTEFEGNNNLNQPPQFFDSYFTDRDGQGLRIFNRPDFNIDGDPNPDFVALHQGGNVWLPTDFHMLWNSPNINRGFVDQANNYLDIDGSDNNIGLMGGTGFSHYDTGHIDHMVDYFSGWDNWINAYSDFGNFYNKIPAGEELTDDEGGLPYDTYWMFGDATVEPDETLTIDPGATIWMLEDAGLTVEDATLLAEGTGTEEGERILFRPFGDLLPEAFTQDNPHAGIVIDGGDDHRLAFVEIWGSSDYALHIDNQTVVDRFQSINIHNNVNGLRVWGTVELIEDSQFNWNQTNGIYLASPDGLCTVDNTTVTNAQYGIRTYNSGGNPVGDITITGCTIEDIGSYCIYLTYPIDDINVAGTTMSRAWRGISATSTVGADVRTVTVEDCIIDDMEYYGISANNRIRLRLVAANPTTISNCLYDGISLMYADEPIDIDRSVLEGCEIFHCGTQGTSSITGGINLYDSNPVINGVFVHDNYKNGIHISTGAEPSIGTSDAAFSNIINNGEFGSQTSTKGAEIRIASSSAMELNRDIRYCNFYDVHDNGQWVRDGYIVSRTTNVDGIDINGNYFGDNREGQGSPGAADRFECYPQAEGSFVITFGQEWDSESETGVYLTAQEEDRWDEVDGFDEEPNPDNAFDAGRIALQNGEWDSAIEAFQDWISQEPGSSDAPAAARGILMAERGRGGDLGALQATFMSLSEGAAENYPELSWRARQLAVECLMYQDRYTDAISEYRNMQESAPDEVEEVIIELSILRADEALSGNEVDDVASRDSRVTETRDKLEKLMSESESNQSRRELPAKFEFNTPYPNPFNETARIAYRIPEASRVRISVFDVSGRKMEDLVNVDQSAGQYSIIWNAKKYSAGIYFVEFEADEFVQTRRITLLK